MVKVLDCDLSVSKFKFQSWYYIHFQSKGKSMNLPNPQVMG